MVHYLTYCFDFNQSYIQIHQENWLRHMKRRIYKDEKKWRLSKNKYNASNFRLSQLKMASTLILRITEHDFKYYFLRFCNTYLTQSSCTKIVCFMKQSQTLHICGSYNNQSLWVFILFMYYVYVFLSTYLKVYFNVYLLSITNSQSKRVGRCGP